MFEFILPDLGEGIHEAEIVKWYVELGATIGQDENLVDVETDKATVTIPTPVGGVVHKLAGEAGDTINVGQVLAVIQTEDSVSAPADQRKQPEPATEFRPAPESTPAGIPSKRAGGPVPAAPATRKLARELGVDIKEIEGSGPAGRITQQDVREYAKSGTDDNAAQPSQATVASDSKPQIGSAGIPLLTIEPLPDFSGFGPVEIEPLRSIRRKTARKMTEAWIQIPHVSHFDEADVTDLEVFRQRNKQRFNDEAGAPLTLMTFVIKATTRALRKFPQFNASLDALTQQIIYKRFYNLGVAVATDRGLMVPVVKQTDVKSLAEIAAEVSDMAERGRKGTLTAEDFRAGTFTVTNMGPVGGTAATPIINHPEVAILAMMRAVDKAVVIDGQVVVRKRMPLVLSFDHRLIDGADAARFVNEIVGLLSDPDQLLLQA